MNSFFRFCDILDNHRSEKYCFTLFFTLLFADSFHCKICEYPYYGLYLQVEFQYVFLQFLEQLLYTLNKVCFNSVVFALKSAIRNQLS